MEDTIVLLPTELHSKSSVSSRTANNPNGEDMDWRCRSQLCFVSVLSLQNVNCNKGLKKFWKPVCLWCILDLEKTVEEHAKHKHMILLLNKCDLVPAWDY